MALANYNDLIAAVPNWLSRADLTSRIPEGIVLAEAKINRKLRTKDMETKNTSFAIAAATEYVVVPTGFGGVRSMFLNVTPQQTIQEAAFDKITADYGDGATGKPAKYCVVAGSFRFGPLADAAYTATLIYYLQVPALTGSAQTNWLMTAHPDVYLYGVNAEMCALTKDWSAAQTWESRMYTALDEVVAISRRDTAASGSLVQRPG